MRVIIVDNEKNAIADTRLKCRKIEDLTEIFCFEDTEMALAFAETHVVDLALLGIEIGTMDGLSLCVALKQINPATAVVFLTAYPKYALEAFRCDASGFL
ncbi:MAG: response regulator, partial [Oscillospiraceae bacterium]